MSKSAAITDAALSPEAVARQLGISGDKVRSWIASGQLTAYNLATSLRGAKPRWRILREDLETFLAGRRATGPAPRQQRRQKPKLPEGFVRYFGRG